MEQTTSHTVPPNLGDLIILVNVLSFAFVIKFQSRKLLVFLLFLAGRILKPCQTENSFLIEKFATLILYAILLAAYHVCDYYILHRMALDYQTCLCLGLAVNEKGTVAKDDRLAFAYKQFHGHNKRICH